MSIDDLLLSQRAQRRAARRTQIALAGLGALVVGAHFLAQQALFAQEGADLLASAGAVATAFVLSAKR